MLKSLSKPNPRKRAAARLYAAAIERARAPVFYARLGVADSVDGRFDLLALHAWLVLDRLRAAGLNDLSQDLMNALFLGFDEGLRDLGAGDMGMGRRMKKLADAFYGRLQAYDASADVEAMTAAVERNLYRGTANAHAAAVARYVLASRGHLAALDIASGDIDFGALP